jgi:membrane protein
MTALPSSRDRGRKAEKPSDIPLRAWWDIAWRLVKRIGNDNVTLVAGGVAMYVMLSVIPGLAAMVSIYGLFASPADLTQHIKDFAGVLPPGTWDIFDKQLQAMVQHSPRTLGSAAAFAILAALWSARSAMSAMMTATNIAYGEREKRSLIVQILLSLAFTVAAVVGFLLTVLLGILIPLALKAFGTSPLLQIVASVLRVGALWGLALLGLAVIYRFAPARAHARWRWVSWGSAIAATVWLAASALFAVYVQTFGTYGKTYGALGGVIVLMTWFYVSSVIAVLGAEANAEIERQADKGAQHSHERSQGKPKLAGR